MTWNQLKYRILCMKLSAQKVWETRNRLLQATVLTATHIWEGAWSDWLTIVSRLEATRTGKGGEGIAHSVRILRKLLPLLWQSARYQVEVGMRHRLDPNARTGWAYVKDEHIFPKDAQ